MWQNRAKKKGETGQKKTAKRNRTLAKQGETESFAEYWIATPWLPMAEGLLKKMAYKDIHPNMIFNDPWKISGVYASFRVVALLKFHTDLFQGFQIAF